MYYLIAATPLFVFGMLFVATEKNRKKMEKRLTNGKKYYIM